MREGNCNVVCEKKDTEVFTAKVRSHSDLKRGTSEFNQFIDQEVTIDPKKVKVHKTKRGDKKLLVEIALKDNPSAFATIFSQFLYPMCENTKKLLSLERHTQA